MKIFEKREIEGKKLPKDVIEKGKELLDFEGIESFVIITDKGTGMAGGSIDIASLFGVGLERALEDGVITKDMLEVMYDVLTSKKDVIEKGKEIEDEIDKYEKLVEKLDELIKKVEKL